MGTASVLGYSLGGGIAVAFADLFSERVDDLVLIAPAGLLKDLPVEAKIVLIPFFGTILAYAVGHALLLKNISDSVDPQLQLDPRMKHMMQTATANVKYNPGLLRGFLETLRNGPVRRMEQAYARVGDTLHDRVLCVWGTCDTVVEFEALSPVFRKLVPAGTLVELKEGTHNVVVETPERVTSVSSLISTSSSGLAANVIFDPSVERLIEMGVIVEKIKPMEIRCWSKVLKAANDASSPSAEKDAQRNVSEFDLQNSGVSDPLQFKNLVGESTARE
ncbi:hypothetical protein HDU77_008071 [Chytriomyces hyalinus]|nr:hypothetical protein HDU77_008071 [Chytriomyces hyalinus]